MATNRELLKEALADAKSLREMAITNAKAALEESFAPQIKSMLSAKLQEMEEEETEEEVEINEVEDESEEEMNEDLNLDEILAELEESDDSDEMESVTEADDDESEEEEDEDEVEDEEEDEAMDLEDMSEGDLKDFIEGVIADMVETGELEAGEGVEGEDMEGEDMEDMEGIEDEEMVNIDELLAEIEDEDLEESLTEEEEIDEIFGLGKKGSGGSSFVKDFIDANSSEIESIKGMGDEKSRLTAAKPLIVKFMSQNRSKMDSGAMRSDISVLRNEMDIEGLGGGSKSVVSTAESIQAELDEALEANKVLTQELNEVNLLNAKLLYTNRIFKSKNLTESQKVKVLSTFDKASNVNEVELVYETLSGTFNAKKKSINENLGSASKSMGTTKTSKPIIANNAYKRMQELAFYNSKQ